MLNTFYLEELMYAAHAVYTWDSLEIVGYSLCLLQLQVN